ncbi:MAG: DUF4124 domain-containing protein [Cycloclasticus sp.]|nr:DUF4124 domain-containing protein [Cycloclasticus sp.]
MELQRVISIVILLAWSFGSSASDNIYKCVSDSGATSFQANPCNGIPEKNRQTVPTPAAANKDKGNWHQRLSLAPKNKIANILQDTLSKSGYQCIVTSTFFQGFDSEKTAYWNAACSNNAAYVISMANNKQGQTRILNCRVIAAMGIECFKKFD